MLKAKVGDVVKVHYTGKLRDGTVFDSSVGGEPLEFTLGFNQLLPAFEEAIIGMSPGESKTFEIPAEDAFGPYRDELDYRNRKDKVASEYGTGDWATAVTEGSEWSSFSCNGN